MTELGDPVAIYREAMAGIALEVESQPPTIMRAEVWPYPDLRRLWVRLETGRFAAFPNLELSIYDPDDQLVSHMFMVEIRQPYQSVTMHLRQSPRPGERYRLELALSRDEIVLDTQQIEFSLIFRDPQAEE